VAETVPVARSPIAPVPPTTVEHGWEVSARRSAAELKITDCTPLAKVLVLAPADGEIAHALGVPFGRAASDAHGTLVVGSGPGEWLLLSTPGTGATVTERVEQIQDEGLVSVFDATHGRALMRITGARAPDLLAKVCAIDLADEVTPNGAAFRSSVAKLVTDVVRDDHDGERSYLLHCERSSGQYLFDALIDAGDEYDIEVDGFVDIAGCRSRGARTEVRRRCSCPREPLT
jgi:heterotetrameric sarcosine oxidase gamma subunit